ncbi:hypothetical protein J2Z65_006067 [Paenibacillus aceris]|uniref:Uncharacterized protein n=1 Tax=Paenibacillus aceris TaxID=869555 RepID=A0ABS4I8K8_9BACL|nr:hypothetical protein [Paenibacillus aceris]
MENEIDMATTGRYLSKISFFCGVSGTTGPYLPILAIFQPKSVG